MKIKFVSHIKKGNKSGTGVFYIPKNKTDLLDLGDWVYVRLSKNVYFFSKIIFYSHRLGIYVPKNLVKTHKLLNKEVEIRMKKIRGFYAPVASDGRVYLPCDIVKIESIHQNDIISIKVIENNKVIQEKYVKIYMTTRPKRRQREFICYLDKALYNKTLLFQIKKLSPVPRNGKINPVIAKLLQDIYYAFIDKDSVIIFKGNKVPTIIDTNLKYSDLVFYFGAYFADGTKKGNSWAICASTFEQARYYLKIHNFLIKDSKPEFTISYTNIYNIEENKLKNDLVEIWQKEVGIKINKFRIRKPSGKSISKWNKYGTLIIREHRQILLDFYNVLLKSLINEILSKEDKKLALDFIYGVMEGDGYASAQPAGGIKIWANKQDTPILKNILGVTEIRYRVAKEGRNKYFLGIGALEILRNFHLLKEKIFILYPKRRKALFERLKTVGAVKFLIGNHGSTNWVKAWLRNNGFVDKNYGITKNGLDLSNNLLNKMAKLGV